MARHGKALASIMAKMSWVITSTNRVDLMLKGLFHLPPEAADEP